MDYTPVRFVLFTVEGRGEFPLDMLRYDAAWPASERDALTAQDREARGVRQVTLRTIMHKGSRRPTINVARWHSFGWALVAEPDTN
jgi:hypothetical protein